MEGYLVVDRSLTVTRRVRDLLEAEGVDPGNVHQAFTAEDALEIVRRHEPSVVLLAVDLPDLGGHELAKDIRRLHPGAQVVVHTTLSARDRRVREAVEDGGSPLLRKPLGRSEAAELVGRPAGTDPVRDGRDAAVVPDG